MTKDVPYYNERFPKGSKARVADRAALEEFMATWNYHHKLRPEQLEYADRVATVEVAFTMEATLCTSWRAYLVSG